MTDETIPAITAPQRARDNPFTRSVAGVLGLAVLGTLLLLTVGTLPWTLGSAEGSSVARYKAGDLSATLLPPSWVPLDGPAAVDERARLAEVTRARAIETLVEAGASPDDPPAPTPAQLAAARPTYVFGTDNLGRDVFVRCLAGGGVSIGIGLAAAAISVVIGTLYGALSGYVGGATDAIMMRIVDILYGLPYILLVVLLAVAGDAVVDELDTKANARNAYIVEQVRRSLPLESGAPPSRAAVEALLRERPELAEPIEAELNAGIAYLRAVDAGDAGAAPPPGGLDTARRLRPRDFGPGTRAVFEVTVLLTAIGGVSWLTMARVIRGQVLSLKAQPFMEAARAIGTPVHMQFLRHLLPNLLGPIIVYATLTVPQAILQESFLSFLGIGVQAPLPSWFNF